MARSTGAEMPERGELIEQVEDRRGRLARRAGQSCKLWVDHQAQPAGIGAEAIRRQDQEHRRVGVFRSPKRKIRAAEHGGHAGAIEEMGMALGGGEHAGGLAIGLADMAIGGAGDQPARRGRPACAPAGRAKSPGASVR